MDIAGVFTWLFSTRVGVICLLALGIIGFLIAALCLERKTRNDYDRYDDDEDSESGWSFFDDDNQ